MVTPRLDFTGTSPAVEILQWKKAYFVGIKGVGMTSLAVMLQEAGLQVEGADVADAFVTDTLLSEREIKVESFFSATLPDDVDGVIFSGAHKGSQHPLVGEARERGLPCLTLAQAVGVLSRSKRTVVTCGVGGKSTTAAWLSLIMTRAGWNPSYSVGVGTIPDLGTSGKWGSGEWLVVEGDEYVSDPSAPVVTPRFLSLHPHSALCTGIAYDHPDVYASWEDTQQAFIALWQRLPADGYLVVNGDDSGVQRVLAATSLQTQVIRVGQSVDCDVRFTWEPLATGSSLILEWKATGEQQKYTVLLPGEHNALNGALSAVLAHALGVPPAAIHAGLAEFHSTPRRFEFRGTTLHGWRCYDDYAHHPRELKAISQTLQTWFGSQPLIVAFQPHTYSRTRVLFQDFVQALTSMPGDLVLLPIFASAREAADPETRSEQLVAALQAAGKSVHFAETQQDLLEYLQRTPGPGVFITLGAGDIYTVYDDIGFEPSYATLS